MSGIFGYLNNRAPADAVPTIGTAIADQLRHLPHQATTLAFPAPWIAMGRIGIGIFNAAQQPVHNAEQSVWLTLTGEFYNQHARRAALESKGIPALAASDAELALQIYLEEGAVSVAALDGAFTIGIWDARSGEFLLINDRYGLYPHYYAHVGGALIYAPEMKAVQCAPEVSAELDRTAIAQYVRFQQLLGERTWLADVQLLPPAALLRFRPDEGLLTITRTWDWDAIGQQPAIQFDDAVDEATRLFQRAIDAMTAGNHRIGIYLSGGLDGRIILGFTNPNIPVTTLTFGAAGCRDVVYATELARRAGRPNHWFPLTDGNWVHEYNRLHLSLTEGMHSWMHAHGISTFAHARQWIDVNLSGWDGATTFGGYAVLEDHADDRQYRYAPDEATLAARMYTAFCRLLTWPGLDDAEAAKLWMPEYADLQERARESLRAELARTRHYPPDRRSDYFVIQQFLRRSLQNQIVNQRAMFEVRCPYFDYTLVEFMYSLPDRIRANPQFRRAVLTKRAPELARVPYDKDDRLPHANRMVRGAHALTQKVKNRIHRHLLPIFPPRPRVYADYEGYLRHELKPWAEAILFNRHTQERGLFNSREIRALWERHQAGNESWTIGKIAPFITIEQVIRLFTDVPADHASTADARPYPDQLPAGHTE